MYEKPQRPFKPTYGTGQVVAAAAAAAAVTNLTATDENVVVTNLGTSNVAYVRIAAAGDASTADYPIPANAQICLTKPAGIVRLSYISASGTSLHIMTGTGW